MFYTGLPQQIHINEMKKSLIFLGYCQFALDYYYRIVENGKIDFYISPVKKNNPIEDAHHYQ